VANAMGVMSTFAGGLTYNTILTSTPLKGESTEFVFLGVAFILFSSALFCSLFVLVLVRNIKSGRAPEGARLYIAHAATYIAGASLTIGFVLLFVVIIEIGRGEMGDGHRHHGLVVVGGCGIALVSFMIFALLVAGLCTYN